MHNRNRLEVYEFLARTVWFIKVSCEACNNIQRSRSLCKQSKFRSICSINHRVFTLESLRQCSIQKFKRSYLDIERMRLKR